jgi:hypothetical protein
MLNGKNQIIMHNSQPAIKDCGSVGIEKVACGGWSAWGMLSHRLGQQMGTTTKTRQKIARWTILGHLWTKLNNDTQQPKRNQRLG